MSSLLRAHASTPSLQLPERGGVKSDECRKGGQDEAADPDDKAKSARKRKAKKGDQRSSKRHQTTSKEVEPNLAVHDAEGAHGDGDRARFLNSVRRTMTYGKMHGDELELDLSGAQDWFQRTDHCELVIRDSDDQLPSEFQRQMAEVKLNHAKKHSQAVLENESKMRSAMMECEAEAKGN